MTDYVLVKRLAEGIVVLSSKFGEQMFTRKKLRRQTKCASCDGPLAVGAIAFSPLTNGYNRQHRICQLCMRAA